MESSKVATALGVIHSNGKTSIHDFGKIHNLLVANFKNAKQIISNSQNSLPNSSAVPINNPYDQAKLNTFTAIGIAGQEANIEVLDNAMLALAIHRSLTDTKMPANAEFKSEKANRLNVTCSKPDPQTIENALSNCVEISNLIESKGKLGAHTLHDAELNLVTLKSLSEAGVKFDPQILKRAELNLATIRNSLKEDDRAITEKKLSSNDDSVVLDDKKSIKARANERSIESRLRDELHDKVHVQELKPSDIKKQKKAQRQLEPDSKDKQIKESQLNEVTDEVKIEQLAKEDEQKQIELEKTDGLVISEELKKNMLTPPAFLSAVSRKNELDEEKASVEAQLSDLSENGVNNNPNMYINLSNYSAALNIDDENGYEDIFEDDDHYSDKYEL
ncbi:hypothetical protein [Thalassomonas sp. RHCl1]|uniref:hypothetical protein n=1 Tax=Thalassomonas sp. RHCl1 TaxID=2995320 RepID=UPI00248AE432|nr:hypothetical protein [Thalassomonas sp. RHCl1]